MENQYTLRLKKIEVVLDTWLPKIPDSAWLEKVFGNFAHCQGKALQENSFLAELALFLTRPGWDLVSRGGKRWRPLLMVLAAESLAGESGLEAALPLTPLVEFPHNASLIHDDLEDNSDERRGKPAVHLIYGTDTAINSGAFMYFLPLACLSAWANSKNTAFVNRIWTLWASHMRALHLGQAMDIAWHRDHLLLPALDEYERMCRLKTGCLARLAAVFGVHLGALVEGNIGENVIEAIAGDIGGAAEQLGVGFQVLDDVKNLCSGNPGKKRGDDIVEGKKSLPVLLYLHRYPEKRDFAARCFAAVRTDGVTAPELEEFIGALEKAGVLEEAREKGMEYIQESRKVFSGKFSDVHLIKEGQELISGLIDLISQ
jgi:octaprenyl-diphosphate synthase